MSAKVVATQSFDGATMTPEGLQFKGVTFQPAVEQCEGCARLQDVESQKFCSTYIAPSTKWALGNCNFATHVKVETKGQVKVNPLKASKRAAKGGR